MNNKHLKRLAKLTAFGLFVLCILFIYIVMAAPAVRSLYSDIPWANSEIDKQKTMADLVVLSKKIVIRFNQTDYCVQSTFGVVLILNTLGIAVFVTNMYSIRKLKAELKANADGR